VEKSVHDGVRHHAAGPVEAVPLALHLHRQCRRGTGRPGPNEVCGWPLL
jgi:hypothetical protein